MEKMPMTHEKIANYFSYNVITSIVFAFAFEFECYIAMLCVKFRPKFYLTIKATPRLAFFSCNIRLAIY